MEESKNNREGKGKEDPSKLTTKNPSLKFGWGKFRPKWLQFLNNPKWFLFGLIVYTILQATIVLGLSNLTLTSIEKRFGITAKQMGVIAASNDVSALLVVLFISYYADYGNKMKWVGGGGILVGLGSLLYALPHFLIGEYEPGNSGPQGAFCHNTNNSLIIPRPTKCNMESDSEWYYIAIFFFGQLIIGAGVSPFYSLAPPYLDENVHPKSLPVYLGLATAATFLAPGFGLVVGGKLLSIYVDLKQTTGLNLTVRDPRWIGAWWLGFIIFGILSIVWSVVILGFPRELPGAGEMRRDHIKKGNLRKADNVQKPSLRMILPELRSLLTNWTFILNTLGVTCTSLYIGAVVPFSPKILQLKFGIASDNTGYALAAMTTPFMLIGTTCGLLVVKRFPLQEVCKKSALLIVVFRALGSLGAFSFLIPGCENVNLAGMKSLYNQTASHGQVVSSFTNASRSALTTSCNAKCRCSLSRFAPVCGSDNVTYFDVCHAGCTTRLPNKAFGNCSCISSRVPESRYKTAKSGYCDRDCKNLLWFAASFALVQVIQFVNVVPEKTVTLRCVPDNKRAFANGVQYIFTKTLGMLPGPLIFGHAIDSSCKLWQDTCGKQGRCFVYDIDKVSVIVCVLGIAITVTSLIFYFLSWYLYKHDNKRQVYRGIVLANEPIVAANSTHDTKV